MSAGHACVGEGEDHDGQAVGEGNREDSGQADTVDHGGGTGADEHEGESADKFREELRWKRV
jgi:hypothetical protein